MSAKPEETDGRQPVVDRAEGAASEAQFAMRLEAAFVERFAARPQLAFAPGRVNLLGEHVDYNGGSVLPLVTSRGTHAAIARRADEQVTVVSLDEASAYRTTLDELQTPPAPREASYFAWAAYVVGVLRSVMNDADLAPRVTSGFDLAVHGSLARGAGLSSSASLEVVTARALRACFELNLDDARSADIAHQAETVFVGLPCGIMDMYAVALGKPGHALHLDCATRRSAHVALPMGLELWILDTCKPRRLVTSVYEERVRSCREAERILARGGELRCLASYCEAQVREESSRLGPKLARRTLHVVTEVQRVRDGVLALAAGEAARFGELMTASHRSCVDDYEISCSELDFLVDAASCIDGVFGARLTGAGFGGVAIALAREGAWDPSRMRALAEAYEARFGFPPRFERCRASPRKV